MGRDKSAIAFAVLLSVTTTVVTVDLLGVPPSFTLYLLLGLLVLLGTFPVVWVVTSRLLGGRGQRR